MSVLNSLKELNKLNSQFNRLYHQANTTSDPEDWGNAALAGRRLSNQLAKMQLVDDNLTILQTTYPQGIPKHLL